MNILVVVSILIVATFSSNTCPQLCQQCSFDTCLMCFNDFDMNAQTAFPADPCECPEGYFLNSSSNLCNFCPARCISCTSETNCIDCLVGYQL